MDSNTVKTIAELAISADGSRQEFLRLSRVNAVVLDGKLHDIESYMPSRSRYRGVFRTESMQDFMAYVTAHEDLPQIPTGSAQGFVDAKNGSAVVYLNLGDPEHPGHGDWRALLDLQPTAAYAAVSGRRTTGLSQDAAIRWCEDWAPYLKCRMNEESNLTAIAKAIAAFRVVTIAAKSESTNTKVTHGASRSALEEVETRSKGALPTELAFTCAPYLDFKERTITLRIAISSGPGDKPVFSFMQVGAEQLLEDIGIEFLAKLKAGCKSCKIRAGTFTP